MNPMINTSSIIFCFTLVLYGRFSTVSSQLTTSTPVDETYVFVGGDVCQKERCTCNGKSYDCTASNIGKLVSGSEDFTYAITLNLEPIEYTATSTIATFTITYIGATTNTNNLNATQLIATDERLDELDSSIKVTSISPTEGEVSIDAQYGNELETEIEGNYGSADLSITFNDIDETNQGYGYSVYKLEIDSCNNDVTCTIVYLTQVYLVIENEMVTTSTKNSNGGGGGSGNSSTGVTVGIIVTVLVVVLIAVVAGVYFYRKKRGVVSYGNSSGGGGGGASGGNASDGKEKLIDEDYNPPSVELNDKDEHLYNQDEEAQKVY